LPLVVEEASGRHHARALRHRAYGRGASRRHRPFAQRRCRIGAAEYPGELCSTRRDRDRRLEGLYAGSPGGLPPFKSNARGFAVGYRGSPRLPRRALGTICDRRRLTVDGGGQLWGETWTTGKPEYLPTRIHEAVEVQLARGMHGTGSPTSTRSSTAPPIPRNMKDALNPGCRPRTVKGDSS
jgi:hypothetical protein